MNNPTNEQIIERLANFMGEKTKEEIMTIDGRDWNPLEYHNHFRMLEERLMEDGKSKLIKDYMKNFDGKFDYMGSTLEERAMALYYSLDIYE